MKVIAMVEIPDDAFDDEAWGDGKWMIDDEGAIRYKEDDAWMHYKDIDVDGIELRPLPQKNKYDVEKYATVDYENAVTLGHYFNKGWNACLDEIMRG